MVTNSKSILIKVCRIFAHTNQKAGFEIWFDFFLKSYVSKTEGNRLHKVNSFSITMFLNVILIKGETSNFIQKYCYVLT